MGSPEAYFLTWTTYGTHLHGELTGSVDHARPGRGPVRLPPSPSQRARESRAMRGGPFTLDVWSREVVAQAIREHAAFKRWALLTISVRSNHVHLLIRAGEPPERVMTACKAWATRALRSGGVVGPEDRVWTRHGSTRWINDRESLDAAYTYITQAQDGEIAANRYGSRRKED